MALTHLVDTSVLTRLRVPAVRAAIEPLVQAGGAARAGISDLEVGYSARNAREWDQLLGALDSFVLLEVEGQHLLRARQVQRLLAARSQRGRKVPDLIIGAVAELAGLTVLHYDEDFEIIARATGLSCQWVVPRGSI